MCCFIMPSGLVHDLALASMGHNTSAVAPKSMSYSLTANSTTPIPIANDDDGFELPKFIFNDVFLSKPRMMVEMRDRKRQRQNAP